MQSTQQMHGAGRSPHSHGSSSNSGNNSIPSSARHPSTVLPPILAPPDNVRVADGPHSASSAGRPPFSRTSSVSSEQGLPKVHHILNPAGTAHEKTSAPPTPDHASGQRPFPPHPLIRATSNERLTPAGSSPCGPPPLRVPAPLSNPTGTIDAKKSPFLPITSQGPPMGAMSSGPGVNPVLGPRQGQPPAHVGYPGPGPWRGGADAGSSQSRTGSPASTHSSYGQPSTTQGSPRSEYSSVSQSTNHHHHPHHQPPHPQYHPHHHQQQQQQQQPQPPPPHHQQQQQQQHHHQQGPPAPPPQHPHHHHQQHQQHGSHPSHYSPQHGQQAQYAGGVSGAIFPIASNVMMLHLEQGSIPVPIDVTAASKTADEKRKRNAGASARFRQRRKEKEREATHTISKLESHVRELENDREFYRMERDYFRDVAMNHEESKASLVQRLPSPGPLSERKRQSSLDSSRGEGGLSPSSAGGVEYRESGDRGSDDGRILRRRISEYEQEGQVQHQGHGSQQQQQQQQQQQHQHQHHHQGYHQQPQQHSPASSEHLQHHRQQQQQQQHHHHQPSAFYPHPAPQHQQRHAALPPSPVSAHPNNGQYSLPTPDSRAGTPGTGPMQPMNVPQTLRSGPYEGATRSAPPVALETRWAAPS